MRTASCGRGCCGCSLRQVASTRASAPSWTAERPASRPAAGEGDVPWQYRGGGLLRETHVTGPLTGNTIAQRFCPGTVPTARGLTGVTFIGKWPPFFRAIWHHSPALLIIRSAGIAGGEAGGAVLSGALPGWGRASMSDNAPSPMCAIGTSGGDPSRNSRSPRLLTTTRLCYRCVRALIEEVAERDCLGRAVVGKTDGAPSGAVITPALPRPPAHARWSAHAASATTVRSGPWFFVSADHPRGARDRFDSPALAGAPHSEQDTPGHAAPGEWHLLAG